MNKVDNISLNSIPCECLYSIGYRIQNSFLMFILIFIIVPGVFLFLKYSNRIDKDYFIYFIIITVYEVFIFLLCMMTYLLKLNSMKIYKNNKKNVKNPFQNMVYYPDLCLKNNVNNEYMEINVEGILFYYQKSINSI